MNTIDYADPYVTYIDQKPVHKHLNASKHFRGFSLFSVWLGFFSHTRSSNSANFTVEFAQKQTQKFLLFLTTMTLKKAHGPSIWYINVEFIDV